MLAMFCCTQYAILVPTQLRTIFKYHNTQTLYPSSFAYPNHISRIPLYEHVKRDYAYILQRATKNTHRSPKRVCLLTCFFFSFAHSVLRCINERRRRYVSKEKKCTFDHEFIRRKKHIHRNKNKGLRIPHT